eukprot:8070853-Pyramimonas_sp.AAC.1
MHEGVAGVEHTQGRAIEQADKGGVADEPLELLATQAPAAQGPAKGAIDAPPPLLGHPRLKQAPVQHAAQRLASSRHQLVL